MENSDQSDSKETGGVNYLANRNSISKFLKDESAHYQEQFDTFCKDLSIDEKGINGNNVYRFMQSLFQTDYTLVLFKAKKYFEMENSEV